MTKKMKIMVEVNDKKLVLKGNFNVEEDIGGTLALKSGDTIVGYFNEWSYWLDLKNVKIGDTQK